MVVVMGYYLAEDCLLMASVGYYLVAINHFKMVV